ncbi:MAG: hypothetical protein AAF799_22345 [Myxococcota bacterium]
MTRFRALESSEQRWSQTRARVLAVSTLVLAIACGDDSQAPMMDSDETGTEGTSAGLESTDEGIADSSDGSNDESSSGGPAEPEYGPSYAVVVSSGPSLPVLQVIDVTEPGVVPELHTLVERTAPDEAIRGALQTNTWSAYAVRNGFDHRLVLHDLVAEPLGPVIEVGGLPAGAPTLHMDEARTLLAVTVAESAGQAGEGFIVDLEGDPSTAVPLPDAPDRLSLRLSPDARWLWGFGNDGDLPGQAWVAPIVDGTPEPFTALTAFTEQEQTYGAWSVMGPDSALFGVGPGSSGLVHADVSDWPATTVTELFPIDPSSWGNWVFARDASQVMKLDGPPGARDFHFDAELVSVVDGVPQPVIEIDLPSASIHEAFITPDGAFAFFTTVYQAGLDQVQVAWLHGPDPGTPQPIGTVPYSFVLQPDPVLLLDGWAVWIAGVGGLQGVSIDGDTLSAAQQLTPMSDVVSSVDVIGQRVFYSVSDPAGAHVPQALWMLDLSGSEPSEPVAVPHPLPKGMSATTGYASPSQDQFFYGTFESGGPGQLSNRGLWSRHADTAGSEMLLLESTDLWGFNVLSPPLR